jgi:hypothetical protein
MLRSIQVIYFLMMAQPMETAIDVLNFLIVNGPNHRRFPGIVFKYCGKKDDCEQPTNGSETVLALKRDIEQAQADGTMTAAPEQVKR